MTDWLWQQTASTSRLTPEQLVDHLFDYLTQVSGLAPATVRHSLLADYRASGARGNPACLQGLLKDRPPPVPRAAPTLAGRQERHGVGR